MSVCAFASIAMLSACSSDDPVVGPGGTDIGPEGESVYMGLTITMPGTGGSRSQTGDRPQGGSDDGIEVGQDYENNVDNVIIVLAEPDNHKFITAAEVEKKDLTAIQDQNAYKTVAKVNKTNLNTYYTTEGTDPTKGVEVFVFCNPTTEVRALTNPSSYQVGNDTWYNTISSVNHEASEIAGTTGKGQFMMANYAIEKRNIPKDVNDWDIYKVNNPFDLSGMNNSGSDKEVDNSEKTTGDITTGGAVKVERSAVRFDFKDGSGNTDSPNTYEVVKNSDGKTIIQIELKKMTLVNLSKTFYNLRRVSDDGAGSNVELCGLEWYKKDGTEILGNYVEGPNATDFKTALGNNFGFNATTGEYNFTFDTYFHNPFFNSKGLMDYNLWSHSTTLKEVLGSDKKSDKSGNYKIWHYAAENVIPSAPANQQNGISTGVVFKGKMIATENLKNTDMMTESGESLYDVLNNVNNAITGDPSKDPILYSISGNLYLTWPEVRKAAIKDAVKMVNNIPNFYTKEGDDRKYIDDKDITRTSSLYLAVFGNGGIGEFQWGSETYYDEKAVDNTCANSAWNVWNTAGKPAKGNEIDAMRAAVTGAGFTIYQSSKDTDGDSEVPGYYCYYYYWNRHNDNSLPGTMGRMEFGAVRNNVYKLAVTKISQLGHPRISENDPDKPKPDTPDEDTNIYMTVTCQVLPWTVRVNNIEF